MDSQQVVIQDNSNPEIQPSLIEQCNQDHNNSKILLTDQSDCNSSQRDQNQQIETEQPVQYKRQGKKNTIHQYYKTRTDRYLNTLKSKQNQTQNSSEIFPDSANDSFQASNQDNSFTNSQTFSNSVYVEVKRRNERKPSTKQYYQNKVMGMIHKMNEKSQSQSLLIKKSTYSKEGDRNKTEIENIMTQPEQINANENSNSFYEQSILQEQEKVLQKHLMLLEKQQQQQVIEKELVNHQKDLVTQYHFLFDKDHHDLNKSSRSAGKLSSHSRQHESDEKKKAQSHQSSILLGESLFKQSHSEKAELFEKHRQYLEQTKLLESQLPQQEDKVLIPLQQRTGISQGQNQSEEIVFDKAKEVLISSPSDPGQVIAQIVEQQGLVTQFVQQEDLMIQQQNKQEEEVTIGTFQPSNNDFQQNIITENYSVPFQQEISKSQEPQVTEISKPESISFEEEKSLKPQHLPETAEIVTLNKQEILDVKKNETQLRTNQKLSALKSNRRNESKQKSAQIEKTVQFPGQEEEKRKNLILGDDEGIKLDLSKLGAINRKDKQKKRGMILIQIQAETKSANSKRSIRSNWTTKTFKEKAEEAAGPAVGTALIGSIGVAITNKVLKGKQRLLGLIPALALGAYFYYQTTKQNEIDNGYEEGENDFDSDLDSEIDSTNIQE